MKTKIITTLVLGAAFLAQGAAAQTGTAISTPSTPAPAVQTPASPAPPAPNQIIYAPRLPSVAELTSAAAAQKLTVQRIEQTSSQVTVVYQSANGQTSTVAYQFLPGTAGAAPGPAEAAPPPATYASSPRVVYYDDYWPGYYPTFWYPPVSLRLGFGFHGGGFRGGGFGFRGHWR